MQTATAVHPFHMAFPVDDLQQAREFYGGLLGCSEGRSSDEWIDFNFYGHQIVAHLAQGQAGHGAESSVDSHDVPVRHFGVVLSMPEWQGLADRLTQARIQPWRPPGGQNRAQEAPRGHNPAQETPRG